MANSVFINQGFSFSSSGIIFNSPGLFPDGTVAAPSISFASEPGLGFYRAASTVMVWAGSGTNRASFRNASGIVLPSVLSYSFTSSADSQGTIDTVLSRQSAGRVNVTTGYAAAGTNGATAGPFTVITSIQVVGGLVTTLTGS